MAQGGESAFNFLKLPYSSHVAALGGSNISAIDDDLSLSMHNPALLINTADKTIDLSFMTYMSGSKVAGAAFNKTFGERSAGAVAARYIDYGKFYDEAQTPNIFKYPENLHFVLGGVGKSTDTGYFGLIDELRISDGALTLSQFLRAEPAPGFTILVR